MFQNTVSGALTKRFAHSVEEASFTIDPCDLHALDEGPKTECSLTRADALKYYKDMVVIRRMETAAANLYKEKAIRGFCHLCSGQEAIYVGMLAALREQVRQFSSHFFDFRKIICFHLGYRHHLIQSSWLYILHGRSSTRCLGRTNG